jgi:hypothetical protein
MGSSGATYAEPRKTLSAEGTPFGLLVVDDETAADAGASQTAAAAWLFAKIGSGELCNQTRLANPSTHNAAATLIAARSRRPACPCRCNVAMSLSRFRRVREDASMKIVEGTKAGGNSSSG